MKKLFIISLFFITNFFYLEDIFSAKKITFYHTVRKGDTLFSISKQYGISISRIKKINKINSNQIYRNDKIALYRFKKKGYAYTVKKGDSIYSIFRKYKKFKVSLAHIIHYNKLKNPYKIFVGQKIFIPDARYFKFLKRYKKRLKTLRKQRKRKNHYGKSYTYMKFQKPTKGSVTSKVGYRLHPRFKKWKFHSGVDVAAPYGTKVFSSFSGKIIFSGFKRGYGNLIIIDHGRYYKSYYGHLSKILVFKGQKVGINQIIGKVGETGIATGPHLHFEIRYKNKPIKILKHISNLKGSVGSHW